MMKRVTYHGTKRPEAKGAHQPDECRFVLPVRGLRGQRALHGDSGNIDENDERRIVRGGLGDGERVGIDDRGEVAG